MFARGPSRNLLAQKQIQPTTMPKPPQPTASVMKLKIKSALHTRMGQQSVEQLQLLIAGTISDGDLVKG